MTLTTLTTWLLAHHLPLCEAGIGLVYVSLTILSWRHLRHHAIAYAIAALLALTLAAGAVIAS